MDAPIFCIVDVQPEFDAAVTVVDEIVKKIPLFRKMHSPIVVVEYATAGYTFAPIMAALEGYDKLYRVTKHQDGGSCEVSLALANVPSKRIIMAGVNTCYCVADTAYGLVASYGYKVTLAERVLGCGIDCDFGGGLTCIAYQRNRIKEAERLNELKRGAI